MKKKLLLIFLWIVFVNNALCSTTCRDYFYQGYTSFHKLRKDKIKSRYRSNWLNVKDLFYKAYKCNEKGSYAPKSLYYIGRTYEELGKRSYLKEDFVKAIEYFDIMCKKFASHSWCDDAKLISAKIKLYKLNKRDDAYIDLLYIKNFYERGDKYKEAIALLKKLDSNNIIKDIAKKSIKKETRCIVKNIRYWFDKNYIRVVADVTNKINYKAFLLNGKHNKRLVLDLYSSILPKNLITDNGIKLKNSIFERIRYAQYQKDVVRIVLDAKGIRDYRSFILEDPFRIVLDVHGKEEIKNLDLVEKNIKNSSHSIIEQLGLDIKTIMIDPGHGGKDPGAIYKGIKEKDINLKLAKILGSKLKAKGFRVLYTRTKDIYVPLEERTVLANTKGADLFISLHVNAHKDNSVRGIEVYYLNFASTKNAIRVAARENAVSTKKISELQLILTDLLLNSKIKESSELASCVLDSILRRSKKHVLNNGVKEAPFYVLMGARMPAILIEIGYLTNKDDRKLLTSSKYLQQLSTGIVSGIVAYKESLKKFAGM